MYSNYSKRAVSFQRSHRDIIQHMTASERTLKIPVSYRLKPETVENLRVLAALETAQSRQRVSAQTIVEEAIENAVSTLLVKHGMEKKT